MRWLYQKDRLVFWVKEDFLSSRLYMFKLKNSKTKLFLKIAHLVKINGETIMILLILRKVNWLKCLRNRNNQTKNLLKNYHRITLKIWNCISKIVTELKSSLVIFTNINIFLEKVVLATWFLRFIVKLLDLWP